MAAGRLAICSRDEQSEHDADEGRRQREHDDEREQQRFELHRHDDIDQEDREQQSDSEIREGFQHIDGLTAEAVGIAVREVHPLYRRLYVGEDAAPGRRRQHRW